MSIVDPSNVQWPSCFNYQVGDRGTMALGVALTEEVPEEIIATEDFENDPISGFGSWLIDLTNPNTGLRCLQSDPIVDNQTTDYTFNVPVGATALRFWYRVSSEGGFDFFQVVTDFFTVVFQDSGVANTWTQQTVDVTGVSFVTMRYTKDSSASSGLDLAAVDDLEWIIPGQPAEELYAPFRLTPDKQCVYVELCNNEVSVTGTVDVRPLDCMTDSITVCPPVSGFEVTINPGICPIPIVAAECIPVNVRLDCEVDSVAVCNFDEIPLLVEISGPITGTFDQRALECELDSVTVCPSPSGFGVTVDNEVDIRQLDCLTDSITVCPPATGFNVTVDNEVNIRPLDCSTDSVEVCTSTPIDVDFNIPGTLNNGAQTTVTSAATQVAAANVNRRKLIIQNVGDIAVRIGTTGLTNTTGTRLTPGGMLLFEMPHCPTNAIFAISESAAVNGIVLVQVVV